MLLSVTTKFTTSNIASEAGMAEHVSTPVLLAEKLNKTSVVNVAELELSDNEDERTFHDTDSAYVLPNE